MSRSPWLLALTSLLFAGCGGGGSGGGGAPLGLLTADTRGQTTGGLGSGAGAEAAAAPMNDASGAAKSIAREIEDADLYKVDGDTLVLANPWRGLVVVDLAQPALRGRVGLGGVTRDLYVRGSRVLVCLSTFDGGGEVLDVSIANPAAPVVRSRTSVGGTIVASRLVGNVLYAVTDTDVRSFLLGTDLTPVAQAALPHGAAYVYATDTIMAVASASDGSVTWATLVDIGSPVGALAVRGSISLEGWVGDQEKLHIGAGTLRVVTHDFVDGGLSRLFLMSLADLDHPTLTGQLDLARGEQTFATRFADDVAYLVTFQQVDPLWVLDLRDAAHPKVAGHLVVPGWSTHLVALPGRLVAFGVDSSMGWQPIASLFDVSNPALPTLLDRAALGTAWSSAFGDPRGFGVFPAAGLVLVPISGDGEHLAVLDLGPTTLDVRGQIDVDGSAERGFPHARGLVTLSTEEVVIASPTTLAVTGRVVIAENAVDAVRLPDGRVLSLIAKNLGGKLGDVALPLIPDHAYPVGNRVAVTGWDTTGRAAYVVDFGPTTPTLSTRFDLGGSWFPLEMGVADGVNGMPMPFYTYGGLDARLTAAGRLVVRGLPGGMPGAMPPGGGSSGGGGMGGGGMGGMPMPLASVSSTTGLDGFVVIDVAHGVLEAPVSVDGGYVSGFALDGETLAYTVGSFARNDSAGRPWMSHDLVQVDLPTHAATATVQVPGYVVSLAGGVAYTIEERWNEGWTYKTSVVATNVGRPLPTELSRLALPDGCYDLRVAGETLFFTEGMGWWATPVAVGGGGGVSVGGVGAGGMGNVADAATPPTDAGRPSWGGFDVPSVPTTTIGTVHLAPLLAAGPSIDTGAGFATLLLADDGRALLVRDGVTLEGWDVSGSAAVLAFSLDLGQYPMSARPDTTPGTYLLALGYGGVLTAP